MNLTRKNLQAVLILVSSNNSGSSVVKSEDTCSACQLYLKALPHNIQVGWLLTWPLLHNRVKCQSSGLTMEKAN